MLLSCLWKAEVSHASTWCQIHTHCVCTCVVLCVACSIRLLDANPGQLACKASLATNDVKMCWMGMLWRLHGSCGICRQLVSPYCSGLNPMYMPWQGVKMARLTACILWELFPVQCCRQIMMLAAADDFCKFACVLAASSCS